MINRAGLGIACALAATLFYGLVPNFVRGGFVNGVTAVETTFFRTAFIAVVLAIAAVLLGQRFSIPRGAGASFLSQAVATLVVSVGYLASVQFIPVGLAAIIFFTFPVIIMLAAPVIEGHSPGFVRIAIAVVAFGGLAVSVGPSFESLDVRGIVLAAAAAVFCAVQFFSGRSMSRFMAPAAFGSLIHLTILPATLAIAAVAGGGKIGFFPGGSANLTGLACMVTVGVLYVGGYFLHMQSLRYAPASTVAPFFNLEPMIATAVAALFLGERLAMNQYVGGGMVLAALAASSFVGSRKMAAP
jgi:drug/metabolite transporter (DMT)-like permease